MEDYKVRLLEEYESLASRLEKLQKALNDKEIKNRVGETQYTLMSTQKVGMKVYLEALKARMENLKLI